MSGETAEGSGANQASEPSEEEKQKAIAAAKAAAAAKAKAEEAPPRPLPSPEAIEAWAGGADANVGILFEDLKLARYDAFNMQIRAKELVAQHWQVITAMQAPDDAEFDTLPEVGRLRKHYKDQELARRRLSNLRVAWRELRGKRPNLWAVPDLLAALRRILDKGLEVDYNELLAAARDLWSTSSSEAGQSQVAQLEACLALIRKGTKK